METKEIIVNAFKQSEKPLSAGQVALATGIDKKDVNKIMKILKKEELIYSPKRCYWAAK